MREHKAYKRHRIDRQLIVSATFLLVAFALFALGTDYARELLVKAEATSSFAIKGDALTQAEVDQVMAFNEQQKEGYSLVFWVQVSDVEVKSENEIYPHAESMSVIYAAGNTGLLFPETNINALSDRVCLMSKGATAVLAANPGEDGLELRVHDSVYRAIGALPSDDTFVVLKAIPDSKVLFDRLTIQSNDDELFPLSENAVEQSLGIDVASLDYRALSFLSFVLLAAVPFVLAVLLIVVAISSADNEKKAPLSRMLSLSCVSICFLVITFIIIGLLTEFSRYFPTRWSVFSEWKSVTGNFAERVQTLFTSKIAVPDEAYYILFATVFVVVVSALASLMISYHFYSVSMIQVRINCFDRFALHTKPSSEYFADKVKGVVAERSLAAPTKHSAKHFPQPPSKR